MEIVLIAAVDINLAIGKDGTIPWDIKEDLKFFKEKTHLMYVSLPSTSPANMAINFEEMCSRWSELFV